MRTFNLHHQKPIMKTSPTNTTKPADGTQSAITTLQIISKHESLERAVAASGMDLSYNPAEAQRSIKATQSASSYGWKSGEAYVTDKGVFYVFNCDIKVLNKFEPFHSMMTRDPFRVVTFTDSTIEIHENLLLPKTNEGRKAIAKGGIIVA